jgi:hypothetical protein
MLTDADDPAGAAVHHTTAAPDARNLTPWGVTADVGTAIGRGSQNASLATAGFFSRFAKKIARSF